MIFRGAAYFFASFERGGRSVFHEVGRGGPTIISQENLKTERNIDQINCNINRQIISSTSYLKNFSGPPSHFRRHLFHSFNLICYDHFSEWMNEA